MARGIKVISYGFPGGYGDAGRAYLRGLEASGVPVTWAPLLQRPGGGLVSLFRKATRRAQVSRAERRALEARYPDLAPMIGRRIRYDTALVHAEPNAWKGTDRERRRLGKRYIGMTVWETTRFPVAWAVATRLVDKVIVPGPFSEAALRAAGVETPIACVPHIAEERSAGVRPPALQADERTFVFYVIATWCDRKALDQTIETYLRTFAAHEEVVLVVRCDRRGWSVDSGCSQEVDATSRIEQIVARNGAGPRVLHLAEPLTESELAGLHQRGDAFVSLTHGEGWCLPAFDAAHVGTPVVITGFGEHAGHRGQPGFLEPELAQLVDYELVPAQGLEGMWAQVDRADAARRMRWVFAHREEATRRAVRLRERLAGRYSAAAVTQQLLAAL